MSFANLTKIMSTVVFGTLGEPVTLLREDTAPLTVTGIFRADHEAVDVSGGVPVSAVQPVLEVRVVDIPGGLDGVEEGDHVDVQGARYQIVDVRPDGHGTLKLYLHKTGRNVERGAGDDDH